jgi:hypothetical protein
MWPFKGSLTLVHHPPIAWQWAQKSSNERSDASKYAVHDDVSMQETSYTFMKPFRMRGVGSAGSQMKPQQRRDPMSKIIKTTLIAASLLAGASFAHADSNSRSAPSADNPNSGDGPDLMEQEERLDKNPTGSIMTCESGTYDANGNCVYMDPNMQ